MEVEGVVRRQFVDRENADDRCTLLRFGIRDLKVSLAFM